MVCSKFVMCALLVVCYANFVMSLDCLLCKSSDLYSECRLGQRKYRPKISKCNGPNAKCFGLASIDDSGFATIRRGCTVDPDFCQNQPNLEFCQTCGSKFCNFWIMDLDIESVEQSDSQEDLNGLDRDANQTKGVQPV